MADFKKVASAVKATGKYLKDNPDVVTTGVKSVTDAKKKMTAEREAKLRFGDYLAYKNSNIEDIEEFSMMRSQTTGRSYTEIMENVQFHINKRAATAPVKPQVKSLPNKEDTISEFLEFKDVAERFGTIPSKDVNIDKETVCKLLSCLEGIDYITLGFKVDYGGEIRKVLTDISEDSEKTMNDFPEILFEPFRSALMHVAFRGLPTEQELEEKMLRSLPLKYSLLPNSLYKALASMYVGRL